MSLPLLTLLGFALWTMVVLMATIGLHRWRLILTGRAQIHGFPADAPTGPDWYKRATRAHANCIENLPVYGAIVGVASFAGVGGWLFDVLSIVVLAARVCQTSVHVGFVQTERVVSIRFGFFTLQLVSMLVMAGSILSQIGRAP